MGTAWPDIAGRDYLCEFWSAERVEVLHDSGDAPNVEKGRNFRENDGLSGLSRKRRDGPEMPIKRLMP
jgi:hypothetical protein